MEERIAIFIDGSNFYHNIKALLNVHTIRIDLAKFVDFLRRGRLLVGVYYYDAPLDISRGKDTYWRQQKLFSELRELPDFKVVLCKMRKNIDKRGDVKYTIKGDDIHLATDMLSGAYENLYDTAILVSGDGDFFPVVMKVKKLGKRVENTCFSMGSSSLLRSRCDSWTLLDGAMENFLKK